MKLWLFLGTLVAPSALLGCAVGPDYHMPLMAVPQGYTAGSGIMTPTPLASTDMTQWWLSLHDRELNSLVARALGSNLDLEVALDRLQEARAQLVVIADQALPAGGATAGGGIGTGSDETKGRATQALRSGETATGLKSINQAGGLSADWELDLFGRIRREVEAQTDDAEALKSARDWVFVTVAADVVRAYLDMRAQQRRLVVLNQDIAAARSSQNLAQTRFDRGLTNEMDVTLAKRQLATLQADVAPLSAQNRIKSSHDRRTSGPVS